MQQFEVAAGARIDALIEAANEILDTDPYLTIGEFEAKLKTIASQSSIYKNVTEDFAKTKEFFEKELNSDYSNSVDTYEDIKFFKEDGTQSSHTLKSDVEAFLYNEGYITYNKKTDELIYSLGNASASYTKEQAIDTILNAKLPGDIEEILTYWVTATDLNDYLVATLMEEHFAGITEKSFPNISGIQFANRTSSVTVNDVTYGVPTYDSTGAVTSGNEVLSITIHKVDPKAIWNFAFTVAPMYYYSDQEHIDAFDYEENFGVEYMSRTFMDNVVNAADKVGVPVGAGPYVAAKSSGGTDHLRCERADDQRFDLRIIRIDVQRTVFKPDVFDLRVGQFPEQTGIGSGERSVSLP